MIRIIAEIGSTHDGEKDTCHAAIIKAGEIGISDIKFQFLEKDQSKGTENISIKPSWIPDLIDTGKNVGINVFCSVWSEEAMNICHSYGMKTIKFAYSMNRNLWLIKVAVNIFDEVIVSCDIMHRAPKGCIELFCIPTYPVIYQVSFEKLFPTFAGFSDHTLGIGQSINAIKAGAAIIEKHVYQNENSKTPDRKIAVSWEEISKLKDAAL